MYSKKQKIMIIAIPLLIIASIFSFFHFMDKAIDNKRASVIKTPVTLTYSEDLKAQANQKKMNTKETPKQIAEGVLLNSVGLGKSIPGYQKTGIADSDGLFVKQAIINGNAVPYSSNYQSDGTSVSLTDFDEADENYWKNVKQSDFDKMKDDAQQQVDDFRNNNKKYQEQEIENDVRKAQYDAKQKSHMKDDTVTKSSNQ